jgi:hypothetical protein
MSSASALNSIADIIAAKMEASPEPVLQQAPTPAPAAAELPNPNPTTGTVVAPEPSVVTEPSATEGEEDTYEFDPDAPVEEAPADAAAQQEAGIQVEKDPYLDIDKEILGKILQLPRGKEMYRDFKQARELSKPIDEGGIGFKPTNDQFREFYESYVAMQQMQGSLTSGDPKEVAKFFDNWLGRDPQTGQMRIAGAEQALGIIPSVIAHQHPELLPQLAQTTFQALQRSNPEALRSTVIDPSSVLLQQQFYALSQQNTDPAQREWLKTVADSLEWLRTGQAPGAHPNVDTNGAPRSNGGNPEVARLQAELETLKKQINQGQQTQYQQSVEQFNREIAATADSTLNADIDNALAKVKTLNLNPIIYDGIKRQYKEEVVKAINSNAVALDLLNQRAAQAARTGNRAAVAQLTREYRALYSVPLTTLRTKYITAAGLQFKSKTDELNAKLQQTQKPGANGGISVATPVTQNGRVEQLPGESISAWMERSLQTQMLGR